MLLDKIRKNGDIRRIPPEQYPELAQEIRDFLVEKVSVSGGHLASNLGVVELTMALHLVFNFERDKVIWDVGHQSYVHKILTGRKDAFDTLRQKGGISGFPKKCESRTDCFDTGHSANSVSAGLGMAYARDLTGKHYSVISVIGDGSSTGGMFFEALNNAGRLNSNFIIILNDNEMSISPNVSGLGVYLSSIRTAASYNELKDEVKRKLSRVPGLGEPMVSGISNVKEGIKKLLLPEMIFENFGVTYLGPVDGHNTQQLVRTLQDAKRLKKAVLVHVVTKKGKGYHWAELHPEQFHGIGPFDVMTGKPKGGSGAPSWTQVFADALISEAEQEPRITAITAAMADGTGLKAFAGRFPDRFYDVGIAEEHAVTFAAGLASGGMIPVCAVYSTFLQRAYDQILEDVCLQKLHVVFAVDRAGIVGQDGSTHQGLFDTSFLAQMPGMTVIAPKNDWELKEALHYAVTECSGPVAVRYGRGEASRSFSCLRKPFNDRRAERLRPGSDATILAVGHMCGTGNAACRILKEQYGISCGLVNLRFISPLDQETLLACAEAGPVVTLEDNERTGGVGERCAAYLMEAGVPAKIRILAVPDRFVEHGSPSELYGELGLDAASVAAKTAEFVRSTAQEAYGGTPEAERQE